MATGRFVDTAFDASGGADIDLLAHRIGQRFHRARALDLKAVQVEIAVEFDEG
jgi:hypothetical protein